MSATQVQRILRQVSLTSFISLFIPMESTVLRIQFCHYHFDYTFIPNRRSNFSEIERFIHQRSSCPVVNDSYRIPFFSFILLDICAHSKDQRCFFKSGLEFNLTTNSVQIGGLTFNVRSDRGETRLKRLSVSKVCALLFKVERKRMKGMTRMKYETMKRMK